MSKRLKPVEKQALFLASHLAIDFLNTESPTESGIKDFLESDEDVFVWLRQAGLAPERVTTVRPLGSLLRAARALRSVIRFVLEGRKVGKAPDLSDLNAFLLAAQSHPQLAWTKSKSISVKTVLSTDTAEQVLAPVALKAAELFSEANFQRVRQCANSTCVHWFYDQTKPGRRRWCSMATCGNRLKVKMYRRRQKST